ncbi:MULTISPECIES: helix-turn-helix domain-containing protein [Halomonadaceae]|uniref:helix-turn-helix domain-containing protein n=1 Tax=Halomonadaceae TaxID=28256 RepID=UPI0015837BDD|nr:MULTISPECIES: helix-turn-helix transcriptional regulator [Halomonas]MDI4636697.1 helix-turn-helix domain-containing protein [Halomonas sp. BMC7]NUJ61062.1 helix-turn-helix transcriptional regulator [Halomonas taeanensis]
MSEARQGTPSERIGRAIARHRLRCGLTQEQVAERLGIGMEAVSRMERGLVTPNISRLFELASLFGCEAADLLRDISPLADDQARRIRDQLERLRPSDRDWVISLMDQLCERLDRPDG